MNRHLHANATATPKIRAYIQQSTASHRGLARELGGSVDTILRWRKRTDVYDASHTLHRLQTTLTPAQEVVTVALRRTLLLSLDEGVYFLNAGVTANDVDGETYLDRLIDIAMFRVMPDEQRMATGTIDFHVAAEINAEASLQT